MNNNVTLLPEEEIVLRHGKVKALMKCQGIDFALIADNATIYYLTGRVYAGFVGLYADENIPVQYFVRRPVGLTGEGLTYIRKPEDIPALLLTDKIESVGLEFDCQAYSSCLRLMKVFAGKNPVNVSGVIRKVRSVKTAFELGLLRRSGIIHTNVYERIPSLYQDGMTDLEFQIEIERESRLKGCLGQFRISGGSMELFMANILVGDNADNPTPYDFAMGGAGQDPSLPVGANGTVLKPGVSVMVDCNGNYTGYMTDMTRVFSIGKLTDLAYKAHECSIHICRVLEEQGKPGIEAKELYNKAVEIAEASGLSDYFMGHKQKAGFVGHGIGIEINEGPVLAPRSKDVLESGNVIAIEPKFVIPGVGAVGIENSYVVSEDGLVRLTHAPEEIICL
ncbi:MAG: Xaa-Pro peptidase family protein [Bacteroidales bacterium]|nr:Xaa-Pro peptidase family protein [Bacteroidales bacterium]